MRTFTRDWKETWVDRMGLIVALSGPERFLKLGEFKQDMHALSGVEVEELNTCLKARFTPSNADSRSANFNGCKSGTEAVHSIRP